MYLGAGEVYRPLDPMDKARATQFFIKSFWSFLIGAHENVVPSDVLFHGHSARSGMLTF